MDIIFYLCYITLLALAGMCFIKVLIGESICILYVCLVIPRGTGKQRKAAAVIFMGILFFLHKCLLNVDKYNHRYIAWANII